MELERRHIEIYEGTEPLEVRADAEKRTWIGGYAAKFNTKSRDLGGFVELIHPGAFAVSLNAKQDIRALVSHDPEKILSRTQNKSLRVWEDERGLRFEAMVPDTTYGRDLLELMRLGTVASCSFGFRCPEGGDTYSQDGQQIIRTLRQVDLREISVVATPAYDTTSVSIRIDPAVMTRVRAGENSERLSLSKAKARLLITSIEGA